MKSFDLKSLIIVALALALGLALGWRPTPTRAALGGSTDGNSDLIAVTGSYGSNASVLFVIDTKSRNMAVYKSMNGQSVELVGARKIEHDLKLMSYRDKSGSAMNPVRLEKEYLRYLSEGGTRPGTVGGPSEVTPSKSDVEEKK
jgi:hypothetical protein